MRPRRITVISYTIITLVVVTAVVTTVAVSAPVVGGEAATWRSPAPPTSPATPAGPCDGWDCALQARFVATSALVASKPGHLGMVIRDRTTGLVWQTGAASRPIWTASTIKLAIVADLLVRGRAGEVGVTDAMRRNFVDMLTFSSNRPATNLWATHGGTAALERYRSVFGMRAVFFPTNERLWGAIKATAVDFAALMSYVLDAMHPDDRDYIVGAMRAVHEVQQWGVWSAGAPQTPGVKDGWNVELTPDGRSHWVMNSVGFTGPDARYVVSVMYEMLAGTQTAGNTIGAGLQAVSDVVATAFGGAVPAKVPRTELLLNPPT